jgi:ubiquinone/menaquinone biosynthesis C-methylase UbiE
MAAASKNYWPDDKCAKAFWNQDELPPYRQLLADTVARLDPRPGERWLDLGCGCGRLSRAVWEKAGGLAELVGLDIAAVNAKAYDRLQRSLTPPPPPGVLRFLAADFSGGLAAFPDGHFDGVVSGLAIQYAEDYSESLGRWTDTAYDRVLADAARVLRPGGRFVFSVNVPEPSWLRVAWHTVCNLRTISRPINSLKRGYRLWRYGGWLSRESRRGRFHYLPEVVVRAKLQAAGFTNVEVSRSFAGEAFLFTATKAAVGNALAA